MAEGQQQGLSGSTVRWARRSAGKSGAVSRLKPMRISISTDNTPHARRWVAAERRAQRRPACPAVPALRLSCRPQAPRPRAPAAPCSPPAPQTACSAPHQQRWSVRRGQGQMQRSGKRRRWAAAAGLHGGPKRSARTCASTAPARNGALPQAVSGEGATAVANPAHRAPSRRAQSAGAPLMAS